MAIDNRILDDLAKVASGALSGISGVKQEVEGRLRQQFDAFARDVQGVFTSAAEDTLRDPGADAAAHRAAKEFLIFASGGNYYEDQLDAMEKAALQGHDR